MQSDDYNHNLPPLDLLVSGCDRITQPISSLRGLSMRVSLLSIAFVICCSNYNAAQLDQVLKKAGENLEHRDTSGLSNDKIIAGLKQALQVSTSKAVALTRRPNGLIKTQAFKIVLPPKLETVGKGLSMIDMGAKVDDLEIGLNRSAEQATP